MISKLHKLFKQNTIHDLPFRLLRSYRHHILGRPDFLLLQCVSACNLKCSHCFLTDFGKSIPDGNIKILPLKEVERRIQILAPMIRNVGAIAFSSFESLMHRNLFQIFDATLKINPRISFPILTNGQLVTPEIVSRLEQYRLSTITISLDGYKPETVESFKTGAKFEKTIQAIQWFVASKHANLVELVFVAHRGNISELPEYIEFVHKLGVRRVHVSNLLTFREELQSMSLYGETEDPYFRSIYNKAKEVSMKLGVDLGLPRLTPAKYGCTQSEFLFIDIEGRMSPCDFLSVQTPFYLFGEKKLSKPLFWGNALELDLMKLWYSQEARSFRSSHKKGIIPESCSHCIDAYGLMCSNRDNS